MVVASYIVSVLAMVSGLLTASFGVLVWLKTLEGRRDDLRTSLVGYVAGLVFSLSGFLLVVAGTEIWP